MAAPASATREFAPLPLGVKLAYASGQLVDGVASTALGLFLLFYLTTVCGMSGGLAGAAVAAGLLVDAVLDPLIGSLSDNWRSRLGRRLPFMLAGIPAVALALVAIFSLPTALGGLGLFVWVTLLSALLRIALSLFVLPYQTIGAEITDDPRERAALVAWRWAIGIVGAIIVVALGFGLFFTGPQGLTTAGHYSPFALVLATIIVAGGALAAWSAARTLARQHLAHAHAHASWRQLRTELAEVFSNGSFVTLFVGALLLFLAFGVHLSLGLHVNTYFWKLTTAQTQAVTLSAYLGLLAGAPLSGPLLARMEKQTVLFIGLLGLSFAYTTPVLLRMTGLLTVDGSALVIFLGTVGFCGASMMAAAAIAFGAMLADAADEHEHLFGARREGLYFAAWAFAVKAASGGGTLIAGLVLEASHFPTDIATAAGAVPPAHAVTWLGLCYGPGAALLTVVAALVSRRYRLDRRKHAAILAALRRKRLGDAAVRDVSATPPRRAGATGA